MGGPIKTVRVVAVESMLAHTCQQLWWCSILHMHWPGRLAAGLGAPLVVEW